MMLNEHHILRNFGAGIFYAIFFVSNRKYLGLGLEAIVIQYNSLHFRPHFFDLLDYVTRRSEELRFIKKKKDLEIQ